MSCTKKTTRKLLLLGLLSIGSHAFCAPSGTGSIGNVALNVLEPTSLIAKLFYIMCYIIGSGLVLGAILQYRIHRQNPVQVTLMQVLLLLLFGLGLIAVPIFAQLSKAAAVF